MAALNITKPGQGLTMDIIINVVTSGLNKSSHNEYYLLICDVCTKFATLQGMHDKTAATVLKTLMTWCATTEINGVTLHPGSLTDIKLMQIPSSCQKTFLMGV